MHFLKEGNTRFGWGKTILTLMLGFILFACAEVQEDPFKIKVYSGPTIMVRNVESIYSDSAVLRVVLKAPLQLEFNNGDREFPEGLHVTFYDEKGVFTATLQSKYGKYDRSADVYVAFGEVVVENVIEKRKLETEELRWSRPEKNIFTDKFVRITTEEEIATGMGLVASQDFKYYRITELKGQTKNAENNF